MLHSSRTDRAGARAARQWPIPTLLKSKSPRDGLQHELVRCQVRRVVDDLIGVDDVASRGDVGFLVHGDDVGVCVRDVTSCVEECHAFDPIQRLHAPRKSLPDLTVALEGVDEKAAALVIALVHLHGDETVLADARELFADQAPAALDAVDALQDVATDVRRQQPDLDIYFDLAELRGYHYHTGIVFAAYAPGHGQALANGGRYDDVGAVFGRARPATGFATDLKALMDLLPPGTEEPGAISMPDADDPALEARVGELRAAGEIVINCLATDPDPRCDRELVEKDGDWQVVPITQDAL